MKFKKSSHLLSLSGFIVILALLVWVSVIPAQCGSQTSNCKNCHETQQQDPVN